MTQFTELNKKSRGFTIAELLVVIAIIGLLGSIVMVSTKGVREKAKIARNLQFSSSVHHAVGAYLVGEWKFEDWPQEDIVADSSGYENHGKWQKAGDHWEDSGIPQLGTAGLFPGDPDFLLIEYSETLDGMNELTLQAWFKPKSDPSHFLHIFYKSDAYHLSFWNAGSEGHIEFWIKTIYDESPHLTLIDLFKVDQWYHVAATYYGGGGDISPRTRLFLNGHLINSKTEEDWPKDSSIKVNPDWGLWLGWNIPPRISVMDDVRIYRGELTSAQIKKLYAEGAKKRGLLAKE